jgi:pyruvate formate lyase activating enzyme
MWRRLQLAAGLGNVERVDVLPFHQMGRFKWKKLGLNYASMMQPCFTRNGREGVQVFRAEGLKAV